jgi:hypothetical protein
MHPYEVGFEFADDKSIMEVGLIDTNDTIADLFKEAR